MKPYLFWGMFLALLPLAAQEEEVPPPAEPPSAPTPAAPENPPNPEPAEKPDEATEEDEIAFRSFKRFAAAVDLVRSHYVDENKVEYDRLIEGALQGMVEQLDPHSTFVKPGAPETNAPTSERSYDALGIVLALRDDVPTIVNVQEEGPAAVAGLIPGDQIMRIGTISTTRVGVPEAIRLLQGKTGEAIKLTVRRPGTNAFLEKELTRQELKEETVKDAHLVSPVLAGGDKIGYVRLLEFSRNSARDLDAALDKMEGEGMQALILDLRNNPGGLLEVAVEVLSSFIEPGIVVVTTEGRVAEENPPPLRTSARGKVRRYPLVVLVDHGSASASELVAAALQDLRRAIVVGTKTFGKGSVQSIIPMPQGGAMRLTIAKYYTPSHRTIHEVGVAPNVIATLTPEAEARVWQWRSGQGREGPLPEQLVKLRDVPYERAVDMLRGLLALADLEKEAPAPVP